VDEDKRNGERQGFAYWSGYTPGKTNPDGTLTALDRDELRAAAARLEVAANDFERRADQATEE
jgi:hypothetical protein